MPWIVAAAAAVVAILVFVVKLTSPQSSVQQAAGPASPSGPGVAPDISMMAPREQADRLFDMIMTAAEQGDTARVAFHTTMAVQAYEMLGELDNDARYHLGLIHVVRGESDLAQAQAGEIEQTVPQHLLAIMLRHRVATLMGDSSAAVQAYARFLANYDSEIVIDRPEYEMHRSQIDAFRTEALGSTGR